MKTFKFFVVLLFLLLITTGCLPAMEGQSITVQKLMDGDSIYEDFNEVTNRKQVRKARELLDNADWKVEKVEMEGPADYRFQFQFKNDGHNKVMSYYLWISSNGDTIEITTDNDDYVHLSAENSTILMEILTK